MAGEQRDPDDETGADAELEAARSRPWGTQAQVAAAVLWPSFLAACFATMLFFAFVDPGLLHEGPMPDIELTRSTAYGVTFFFFWLVGALSSAVSVYLIRTSHMDDRDQDAPP